MARYSIALSAGAACLALLHAQTLDDASRVVHFDANIVQVDAAVTDAHGAFIRDLKAEDFHVQQDGKNKKITSFSYVSNPGRERLPRTTVFLINDGNMVAANMVRVRDALGDFADEPLHAGDSIALLTSMGGAGYLRQFSTTGPQLRAAIADLRWRPPASDAVVLSRTMELLRRTIVALADVPGRKSIVVISNDMLGEGIGLRSIADAASRASVVVYAVNPRPAQFSDLGESFLPGLAAATGGMGRAGGLDLAANLRAVLDDQAGYYLIGWDPGPVLKQLWSWPVYHRLTVKTSRPALTVRSRDGFFGVSGPVAINASASKMQQILTAMFTPLRPQTMHIRVTPALRQRDKEPYLETLIHISSGIELTPEKDDCYRANLTIYSSLVRANGPDDPALSIRGAGLRVCGHVAQTVRENGLVARIEQRLPGAGEYQVYVGIRNGSAGAGDAQNARPAGLIRRADWKEEAARLGTASEFVHVPDPGTALPALGLRGAGTLPTGAGAPAEIYFRTVAPGDPAIRDFRRGSVLAYTAGAKAKFQIVRDEEIVDSGTATGTCRLKESLTPGQYLLEEKSGDDDSIAQWTDFRIVN